MKALIAIAAVALVSLQGCATITDFGGKGSKVVATYQGKNDDFANCKIKIGDWSKEVISNTKVSIPHKRGILEVTCEDETLQARGFRTFESNVRKGAMAANIITDFCTFSCLTDFATGSIYEFPSEIVVPMVSKK